jgi:hypothetical protein
MSEPIIVAPLVIGKTLSEQIAEHNARVERIWLTVGSRSKAANAKRAAYGEATLSELLTPEGGVEPSFGVQSDGSSTQFLTRDY